MLQTRHRLAGDHIDMPWLKVTARCSARGLSDESPNETEVNRSIEEPPDGPSCRHGIAYFHTTLQIVTCLIEPKA
jgi:hypothetical protein